MRFSLAELFVLVTVACVAMSIHRVIGSYYSALLAGAVINGTVVARLKFDTFIGGALAGAAAGLLIYLVVNFFIQSSAYNHVSFAFGCLFHIVLGYLVGMCCTADRLFREAT